MLMINDKITYFLVIHLFRCTLHPQNLKSKYKNSKQYRKRNIRFVFTEPEDPKCFRYTGNLKMPGNFKRSRTDFFQDISNNIVFNNLCQKRASRFVSKRMYNVYLGLAKNFKKEQICALKNPIALRNN